MHFKSTFQIQWNKMLFIHDACFILAYSCMFRDRLRHVLFGMFWDRVPFFFLCTLHASLPWLCVQLDFLNAYYSQKFALTRPLCALSQCLLSTAGCQSMNAGCCVRVFIRLFFQKITYSEPEHELHNWEFESKRSICLPLKSSMIMWLLVLRGLWAIIRFLDWTDLQLEHSSWPDSFK